MSQFDDGAKCPECGAWGAKKFLWKVKCRNPACVKYDAEYGEAFRQSRTVGKPASEVFTHLEGDADINDYSLQIRYQNFRGDELIYAANPKTAYKKGEFLIARLAPTGRWVTFRLERIQNRSDAESAATDHPQPSTNERRILRYHLRRGTSSPAFEKLKEKYPDYQA